jgi:hypothetical protein
LLATALIGTSAIFLPVADFAHQDYIRLPQLGWPADQAVLHTGSSKATLLDRLRILAGHQRRPWITGQEQRPSA